MSREEILLQLNNLFVDVLNEPEIELTESMTANDVEGWDSLTHIQIVVKVEKLFKIRFNSQEIQNWKSIADMINSIEQK